MIWYIPLGRSLWEVPLRVPFGGSPWEIPLAGPFGRSNLGGSLWGFPLGDPLREIPLGDPFGRSLGEIPSLNSKKLGSVLMMVRGRNRLIVKSNSLIIPLGSLWEIPFGRSLCEIPLGDPLGRSLWVIPLGGTFAISLWEIHLKAIR